jgi:hypothetical protein
MGTAVDTAFVAALTVCLLSIRLSIRKKLDIGDSDFYGMY